MPAPADFKSDWIAVDNSPTRTIEIAHNLNHPPERFIMIFSPTGPGPNGEDPAEHYFADYRWYDQYAQNPVSVKADKDKFYLSVTASHPIFAAFGPDSSGDWEWTKWDTGYVQIMAFIVT